MKRSIIFAAVVGFVSAALALDNIPLPPGGSFYDGTSPLPSRTITNLTTVVSTSATQYVSGKLIGAVQTHVATGTATAVTIAAPTVKLDAYGQTSGYSNVVTVAANATDGQRVTLFVPSGATNSAHIVDAAPCSLAGDWLGGAGDSLSLLGVGTNWVETGRSNN